MPGTEPSLVAAVDAGSGDPVAWDCSSGVPLDRDGTWQGLDEEMWSRGGDDRPLRDDPFASVNRSDLAVG